MTLLFNVEFYGWDRHIKNTFMYPVRYLWYESLYIGSRWNVRWVWFFWLFQKLQIRKTFERHPNGDLRIALTLAEQCQLALGFITAITLMWRESPHPSLQCLLCKMLSTLLRSLEFCPHREWQVPGQVMPGAETQPGSCRHPGSMVAIPPMAGKAMLQLYVPTRKWVLRECESLLRKPLVAGGKITE